MNDGFLDVLNCGAGHINIKFDKSDKKEVAKAKKIINDMLARGYLIFVQVGDETERVTKFDPKTDEYIIEEAGKKPRRLPLRKTKATGVAPVAGG